MAKTSQEERRVTVVGKGSRTPKLGYTRHVGTHGDNWQWPWRTVSFQIIPKYKTILQDYKKPVSFCLETFVARRSEPNTKNHKAHSSQTLAQST